MLSRMDDVTDLLAQQRCPECRPVLRDAGPGYHCGGCGLLFLRDGRPLASPGASLVVPLRDHPSISSPAAQT